MSPQKENGYTPIANELLEAFCKCKLLEYERCIVMTVWRKTYGWSKKEDWIANSQLSEATGIARPNITRTIKSLVAKKVLQKTGKKVSVNKNYLDWKVEWRIVISPDNRVISPDNKKLSHQIPTKAIKQLTKTISDKSQDMSWKTTTDDFEEGTVDLDGNGETEVVKKPQTKKYPNAPEIRKIFQEVLGKNPASWNQHKTQLLACENLYTERTPVKVRSALLYYQANQEEKYCPQISSPYDLDSKWTKLGEFKLKQV